LTQQYFWLKIKNRLRTTEAEILKKLRTASFNSEFTGSYKKMCTRTKLDNDRISMFLSD